MPILLILFIACGIGAILGLFVKTTIDWRMLKREARSHLLEGETVVFESLSRRSPSWWQNMILVDGLLSVTDRRLIWTGWLIPMVKKRTIIIEGREVDDLRLKEFPLLGTWRVEVVRDGDIVSFFPCRNRWAFFNGERAEAAFAAIKRMKDHSA